MKLLDQVRQVLRVRHYSYRTEQCYVAWIVHYLRFSKGNGAWRHPRELGAVDVELFLTHLAVDRHVSASTQNQALNALVFLYGSVLQMDLGDFNAVRAARRHRLPTVLSRPEVGQWLERLEAYSKQEPYALIARLLYGAGLRLMECCRLRVKDVDLERGQLSVRGRVACFRRSLVASSQHEPTRRKHENASADANRNRAGCKRRVPATFACFGRCGSASNPPREFTTEARHSAASS